MHDPHTDSSLGKILDPHLARLALRGNKPAGEFGVIVRFHQPNKTPRHMKVTGQHSPGYFKARIPCSKINSVLGDRNILSIELREHVTQ
jgi:hypothetical protein